MAKNRVRQRASKKLHKLSSYTHPTQLFRNDEHYYDPTAGTALKNAMRKNPSSGAKSATNA